MSSDSGLFPTHGSWSGSGVDNHEPHRRKSRMVEISLSGSGEGPGRVTSRPTLQRLLIRFEWIQQRHYGMKLLAYTLINLRVFCGT